MQGFLALGANVDVEQIAAKETEYVEADLGAGDLLFQADGAYHGQVARIHDAQVDRDTFGKDPRLRSDLIDLYLSAAGLDVVVQLRDAADDVVVGLHDTAAEIRQPRHGGFSGRIERVDKAVTELAAIDVA